MFYFVFLPLCLLGVWVNVLGLSFWDSLNVKKVGWQAPKMRESFGREFGVRKVATFGLAYWRLAAAADRV